MKKFNTNEFNDFQFGNKRNGSTLDNVFVPVLIVACSCLAMLGVTFSTKLVENDTDYFKVKVDIINGEQEVYEKTVKKGAFRDIISSTGTFGSISCTQGELSFDPITNSISSVYIDEDTSCVLAFMDDGVKEINVEELTPVNDNLGVSYYYSADSNDNYIMLENTLFRIVRVNGDGTLRVMLNDIVLSSVYGSEQYGDSQLKATLDNWFNTKFKYVDYVVKSDFDSNNYEENYDTINLVNIGNYTYDYVGTLSVREALLMSKDSKGGNFLNATYGFYLMNPSGHSKAYYYNNGNISLVDINNSYSVRPVINIKVNTLTGNGTINNPYLLS